MLRHSWLDLFRVLLLAAVVKAFVLIPASAQNTAARTLMFEDISVPGPLYTVKTDGTGLRRLTANGDNVVRVPPYPVWSPDGRQIAFVNWQMGLDGGFVATELYVMDRDGANRHLLMHITEMFGKITQQITGIAWSPDGKLLAVTRLAAGLFLVPVNGQGETRLIFSAQDSQDILSPSWSPDGKRIAFYTLGRDSLSAIQVVDADGSHDVKVSSSISPEHMRPGSVPISWSRDGQKMYFALLVPMQRSALSMIHRANTDGSGDTQLIGGFDPTLSPDGKTLAFTGTRPARPNEIFVMNEDGSNVRQLTNDPDWACTGSAWSSDGKQLVLSCHSIKGTCRMAMGCNWRMFVIPPDSPRTMLKPIIDRDALYPSFVPLN